MRDVKLDIKPNKSLTYMLPFLDSVLDFKFKELILNSYISFDDSDELFCILYDWKSDRDFLKFEGELMNHTLYCSHEDYNDKVLFKFRLPKNLALGRDLFLKGDYKSFSGPHKRAIIDYLTSRGVSNLNNIREILDVDKKRTSATPDRGAETFIKQLKIIDHKPQGFKYEGS